MEENGRKRELTSHMVNGCNEQLHISVMDGPGAGGASHKYCLFVPYDAFNQELNAAWAQHISFQNGAAWAQHISFQNGPIKEVGTNGITHEALLAILEDRLVAFQAGQYACTENELALGYIRSAQLVLKERTAKRLARGVEGTHEK